LKTSKKENVTATLKAVSQQFHKCFQ